MNNLQAENPIVQSQVKASALKVIKISSEDTKVEIEGVISKTIKGENNPRFQYVKNQEDWGGGVFLLFNQGKLSCIIEADSDRSVANVKGELSKLGVSEQISRVDIESPVNLKKENINLDNVVTSSYPGVVTLLLFTLVATQLKDEISRSFKRVSTLLKNYRISNYLNNSSLKSVEDFFIPPCKKQEVVEKGKGLSNAKNKLLVVEAENGYEFLDLAQALCKEAGKDALVLDLSKSKGLNDDVIQGIFDVSMHKAKERGCALVVKADDRILKLDENGCRGLLIFSDKKFNELDDNLAENYEFKPRLGYESMKQQVDSTTRIYGIELNEVTLDICSNFIFTYQELLDSAEKLNELKVIGVENLNEAFIEVLEGVKSGEVTSKKLDLDTLQHEFLHGLMASVFGNKVYVFNSYSTNKSDGYMNDYSNLPPNKSRIADIFITIAPSALIRKYWKEVGGVGAAGDLDSAVSTLKRHRKYLGLAEEKEEDTRTKLENLGERMTPIFFHYFTKDRIEELLSSVKEEVEKKETRLVGESCITLFDKLVTDQERQEISEIFFELFEEVMLAKTKVISVSFED